MSNVGTQILREVERNCTWLGGSMHHKFHPGFCWLEAKYILMSSKVDKQVLEVDWVRLHTLAAIRDNVYWHIYYVSSILNLLLIF